MRGTVRKKMTRLKHAALLGGLASTPWLWSGCQQTEGPMVGAASGAEAPGVAGLEGTPPATTVPAPPGSRA
ncbi:hypothetical protein ACLEPN_30385, partial [Myxococcus sp. 1LA]